MTLEAWTLNNNRSVLDDALPALNYRMLKGFKASFSTLNPSNSSIPIGYLVGWNSAAGSGSGDGSGGYYSASANNLQNFLSDVLGYAYLDDDCNIHRVLPDSLYDWPIFYAQSADVEGYGPAQQGSITLEPTYPAAKVVVDYKPLDFAVLADDELSDTVGCELERFVTRGFGFDSQYLTLNGQMKYVTSPQQVLSTQPGKITSTQELNYTWHQVPAVTSNPFIPPNLSAIMACIGTVNQVPFDVFGINAPPGTVLFTSADVKMELPTLGGSQAYGDLTWGGLYYWTITFKFSYRFNGYYCAPSPSHGSNNTTPGWGGVNALTGCPIGHNFVYRTLGGTGAGGYSLNIPFWDLVSATGGYTIAVPGDFTTMSGPFIYQKSDLNTLFTITEGYCDDGGSGSGC